MSIEILEVLNNTGEPIYAPELLTSGSNVVGQESETNTFRVVNLSSEESVLDAGIFLVPATDLGEIRYSADEPAPTDFMKLLAVGSVTNTFKDGNGVILEENKAGVSITYDVNGVQTEIFFSRQEGSKESTKIPLGDFGVLCNNNELTIKITWYGLGATFNGSRRLYVGVSVL